MPGAGVASQSIWRSGWRKPQRRRREVSFTHEIVLVPSNCHCRTATRLTGFSAAAAQVMDLTLVTSVTADRAAVYSTTVRSKPDRSLAPPRRR